MKLSKCLLIILVALVSGLALAEGETEQEPHPDLVAPSNATERWLDSVIIPEMDFRAAHLPDCLDFVVARVNASVDQSRRERMRVLFDLEAVRQYVKQPLCPTFRAVDISAFRALKIIEALAEFQIESLPGQLIVATRKESANQSMDSDKK